MGNFIDLVRLVFAPALSLDVLWPYRLLTRCSSGENNHFITSDRKKCPVFSLAVNPE
jgi:hypothetical protein